MQRILLALGMAALATLAAAGAAEAEVVTNTSVPFTGFTVFVPCANGGAGELIVGTGGELHILITLTVNGNNVSGKDHAQPQAGTLVGSITGDTYHATGVTQDHFKFSLQDGQSSFTFVNNFRMIAPRTGNNFLVHETFHITVNATATQPSSTTTSASSVSSGTQPQGD
jgi:hypothetical protein